jgi:hypothetical protein
LGVRVSVSDEVKAPLAPDRESLRDRLFTTSRRWSFGLVGGSRWRLRFGPLTLLRFGEPEPDGAGWSWPIEGGLLTGAPGGRLRIGWENGALSAKVEDYRPLLPQPFYRLLQVPVHHLTTRLFLLGLRGRAPAPATPATAEQRLVARLVDLGICALLCRNRRLPAAALLAGSYHAAAWTLGGRTLGDLIAGVRVVSFDGSPVSAAQALTRLLCGDEIAGTEVVATG